MDASQLNPPAKYGLEVGSYLDAMPALLRNGYRPLSTAAVMDVMLEVHETKDLVLREHLVKGWHDWYKDTPTGRRKHRDTIRIVLEDPLLLGVTPQSQLNPNGSLAITPDQFNDGDGHDLSYVQLTREGIDRPLEKDEVYRADAHGTVNYTHCGWLAYADGSIGRLQRFADMVFAEGKRRFDYDKMMGLYILNEEGPAVRPVVLGRLGDGSDADVRRRLDGADAQLVGVRRASGAEGGASARPPHESLETKVG